MSVFRKFWVELFPFFKIAALSALYLYNPCLLHNLNTLITFRLLTIIFYNLLISLTVNCGCCSSPPSPSSPPLTHPTPVQGYRVFERLIIPYALHFVDGYCFVFYHFWQSDILSWSQCQARARAPPTPHTQTHINTLNPLSPFPIQPLKLFFFQNQIVCKIHLLRN